METQHVYSKCSVQRKQTNNLIKTDQFKGDTNVIIVNSNTQDFIFFNQISYKCNYKNVISTHEINGFDTTSALFGLEKSKFWKNIISLRKSICIQWPRVYPSKNRLGWENCIIVRYSGCINITQTFNTRGFQLFAKSSTKSKFHFARSRSTQDVAQYHFLQCHNQVQTWIGSNIPLENGVTLTCLTISSSHSKWVKTSNWILAVCWLK